MFCLIRISVEADGNIFATDRNRFVVFSNFTLLSQTIPYSTPFISKLIEDEIASLLHMVLTILVILWSATTVFSTVTATLSNFIIT